MKTLLPRRNGSGYVVMCAPWCCMKIGGGAGVRRRLDAVLTVGEVVRSVDCRGSGAAVWYMSMSRGGAMIGRAEKQRW